MQRSSSTFSTLLLLVLPCEAAADDLSHSLAKESCLKRLIFWDHQRLVLRLSI